MAVATGGGNLQTAALPLYVQRLGQLLNISPLLDHIEKVFAGSDDENFKSKQDYYQLMLQSGAVPTTEHSLTH
ncbi:hypothetical protein GBAR_LOCUS16311 [Geodia barretti]|uniref:Uncharacterized protein n=1 Tax=Geodia barretti TaxID=519541 RepID=A0AA35SFC3_GEOBA|nr:hypothetical protein GBAR_LOCUS16311 [Geodia barretti]